MAERWRATYPLILALVSYWVAVAGAGPLGDADGDGVVDGKDALRVLQIAEGLVVPGDEERARCDVFPLKGTGERPFGDGKVTRDDALQILRMLVGAAGRGETTGEFDAPAVTDIAPSSGPIGTRVTVTGSGFLTGEAAKGNMLVLFGSVPAETVTGVSSTALETVVPAGVTEAPVVVLTPGGEARSTGTFLVKQVATGRLDLPAGFSPADASVVSTAGAGTVDGEGAFTAPVFSTRSTIVMAMPKGKEGALFLRFHLPQDATRGPGDVDAASTAEALVLFQPFFGTADTAFLSRFRDQVRALPEMAQLSRVVEAVWPQSAEPLKDPRVGAALDVAILAAVNILPIPETRQVPAGPAASRTASPVRLGQFYGRDVGLLDYRFSDNETKDAVRVRMEFGSPVDWFVRIARLDPAGLPRRVADLSATRAWPRTAFTEVTDAKATRITTALMMEMVRPVVAGLAGEVGNALDVDPRRLDEAVDRVCQTVAELVGEGGGLDIHLEELLGLHRLPIEENAHHGVYVIRAFSGVVYDRSPGHTDLATINEIPLGSGDAVHAALLNGTMAVFEVLNALIPLDVLQEFFNVPGTGGAARVLAIKPLIKIALRALIVEGGEILRQACRARSRQAAEDAFDALYAAAVAAACDVLRYLQTVGIPFGRLADAWRVLRLAGRAALRVITLAPAIERLVGMTGFQIPGFDVMPLTPLETVFVFIGRPFGGAIIDDFNPKSALPGETVVIDGYWFSSEMEENTVRFADARAEVTGLSRSRDGSGRLEVRVPTGAPPGAVPVSVEVTGARPGVAAQTFQMGRFPVLERLTPHRGFAPGTFNGQPTGGTEVTITGRFFGVGSVGGEPAVEDRVFFGDQEAVVDAAGSTTTSLLVRVPSLPSGADTSVVVQTPSGYRSNPMPFHVIGPPAVTSASTVAARSGGAIRIEGSSFAATDTGVRFEFDGGSVLQGVEAATETSLRTNMPAEVPEGTTATMAVVTPAGVSNGVQVQRLPGWTQGATLPPTGWQITYSTATQPDGEITFGEAVAFMQGTLDPFADGYDDTDLDVVIQKTDRYRTENNQLVLVDSQTVLASSTPRGARGHPGTETAYVTVRQYRYVDGQGGLISTNEETYSLDNPQVTHIHGQTVAGIGRREEGDAFTTSQFGKDFADSLTVDFGATAVTGDIVLGGDGDTFSLAAGQPIAGNLIIRGHENRVVGNSLEFTGCAEIQGNGNSVRFVRTAGGFLVDGGSRNELYRSEVRPGDARPSRGIVLQGGASLNTITFFTVSGCETGVEITGGAYGNEFRAGAIYDCPTSIRIQGVGTRENIIGPTPASHSVSMGISGTPPEVGVEICGGASGNQVEVKIGSATGDGVAIHGAGTRGNTLRGEVRDAGGNGVHLYDGAAENRVGAHISGSGGHGVLIEGEGTDGNRVGDDFRQWDIEGNARAGVAVLGTETAQPYGTRIEEAHFGPNGEEDLLLRNLQRGPAPTVVVGGNMWDAEGEFGDRPGMVLENVRGARLEANDLVFSNLGRPRPVAIQLKGAGTTGTVALMDRIERCSIAGIQITDGASDSTFDNLQVNYCPGIGILVEGGATGHTFISREATRTPYEQTIWGRSGSIDANATGVVIRGGAQRVRVENFPIRMGTDGVIIEGTGTTGNTVVGNRFLRNGVIVRDGATDTTIGSEINGLGNSFSDGLRPVIEVRGTATEGVHVLGNTIQRSASARNDESILVEGAREVHIGQAGSGRNTIESLGGLAGIRVRGAAAVFIGNNLCRSYVLDGAAAGIVVEGGCQWVTIGSLSGNEGNEIVGHKGPGIHVTGAGQQDISIFGNTIGTPSRGNVVGVLVDDGSQGVRIVGNTIQHNREDAIRILGSGTTGTDVRQNTITRNGAGVVVADGARLTTIRDNRIFDNTLASIRLSGGSNDALVAPTLTAYRETTREVVGTLASSVPVGSTVEVYAAGSAQVFLGIVPVRAVGQFSGQVDPVPPGMRLLATVTDPQGNTSEFSEGLRPGNARPPSFVFTTTRFGNREIHRLFPGEAAGMRLTDHPAVDDRPALSPDLQRVAFVSDRSGNADIWVMESDGANPRNLTAHAAADLDPAWSPDGQWVVFVSDRDGNPELFVMKSDGTQVRQLTQTGADVANFCPAWSPDGARIAYARGPAAGGAPEICVISAAGGEPTNISSNAAVDTQPCWSPDGLRIAFTSERDGNPEIYVMRADGSDARRLTNHPAADLDPAWTSTGEVLFASSRSGDYELYAMGADGSSVRQVTVSLGVNVQPSAGP